MATGRTHDAVTVPVDGSTAPADDTPAPARPADRWIRRALLVMPALAALGSFVSASPGSSGTANGYRLVTAVALIPALLMLSRTPSRGLATKLLLATTVAFAVWGPIGLSWTPAPDVGQRQLLGILLAIAGAWVAIGLTSSRPETVQHLRAGFVLAAFVLTSIGLWQYATGNNLWSLAGQTIRFDASLLIGSFVNPNNFAAFLLGCAGPVLSWALSAKGIRKPFAVALLAAMAFVVLGTTSRAGVLGLLVIVVSVLIIVMMQAPKTQVPVLFTLAALSLGTWAAFSQQITAGLSTAFAGSSGSSDDLRVALSQTAVRYFFDSGGLGIGPAGFQERLALETSQSVLATHNTFLQMAAEYGFPVALPAFALVAVIATSALRSPNRSQAPVDPARIEMLAGIIAICVGAVVASSLIADPSWWLLIGYLVVLTRQSRGEDSALSESPAPAN